MKYNQSVELKISTEMVQDLEFDIPQTFQLFGKDYAVKMVTTPYNVHYLWKDKAQRFEILLARNALSPAGLGLRNLSEQVIKAHFLNCLLDIFDKEAQSREMDWRIPAILEYQKTKKGKIEL